MKIQKRDFDLFSKYSRTFVSNHPKCQAYGIMGDRGGETLGSKIRFSGVLKSFPRSLAPSPPPSLNVDVFGL